MRKVAESSLKPHLAALRRNNTLSSWEIARNAATKAAAAGDRVVSLDLTGPIEEVVANFQKIRAQLSAKGYQNAEGVTLSVDFSITAPEPPAKQ